VPYDVAIITVRPNTFPKIVGQVDPWLHATPRKGEFLACLFSDIGALNQIMLIHQYAAEADLAEDREAVLRSANPFGIAEAITGIAMESYTPFPFLAPLRPGQYGPIFEVRSYVLRPGGLTPTIEAWAKAAPGRQKLSPILAAMYTTGGEVTRFMHIWPYPSLDVRAQTRRTAIETGVWPPLGGPDHLQTMRTDIFLPATFSPIR
jgi:NIPSNAP